MELKNKNILLTGGSSGIGKKTAEMLVEKGAKVLITVRSYDKIDTIKQHLNVLGVSFDISDIENIAAKTDECVKLLGGRVDVLINNAGIGDFGPVDKINMTSFLEVFNTNVFGLALLTKGIIPIMKKQSQGTIINIGSSASIRGFKNGSVYAASKFAVRAPVSYTHLTLPTKA